MKHWILSLMLLAPLAQAGNGPVINAPLAADGNQALCLAASSDGALEIMLEGSELVERPVPVAGAELLMTDCGGQTLLQVLVDTQQAENLEYAVIDLGVDVNAPLVREEGGMLSLAQYLIQQAVEGRDEAVRGFALEYVQNFRDGEFNPNLYLLSMN